MHICQADWEQEDTKPPATWPDNVTSPKVAFYVHSTATSPRVALCMLYVYSYCNQP